MNNQKLKNTFFAILLLTATMLTISILPINHIHLRKYGKNTPYFGTISICTLAAYIILMIFMSKVSDINTTFLSSDSKVNSVISFIRIFSFSFINSENRTLARNSRDGFIASETAISKIYVSWGILIAIWTASFIIAANWDKISKLWDKNNIQ